MKLLRPLVFIDIEATGVDVTQDRILEFAAVVLNPDGTTKEWVQRFNPGMPIPAESTAIHGITDADVAGCPMFSQWATHILKAIRGKDLAGYNLWRFDLPILDEELRRHGLKLDLSGTLVIDAFGIFAKKEPRNLSAAVQKFCGRQHEGAHGALADSAATLDVLNGQMSAYPDLAEMALEQLAAFSRTAEHPALDLAGNLYRDADGDAVLAFGKNKGKKVRECLDYADWMIWKGKFPGSTTDALREELDRIEAAQVRQPEAVTSGR